MIAKPRTIIGGVATGIGLGLLLYVVALTMFGNVCGKTPQMEAGIETDQFKGMINAYYLSSSPKRLPDSLHEMTEGLAPLTREIPLDPWGNEYQFIRTGTKTFEVFSMGPDGEPGTCDDIDNDWDPYE